MFITWNSKQLENCGKTGGKIYKTSNFIVVLFCALCYFTTHSSNEIPSKSKTDLTKTQVSDSDRAQLTEGLFKAVVHGNLDVATALINQGADVNSGWVFGDTPLIGAVWSGKIEVVKSLVEMGANVNAQNKIGETALFWAVCKPEIAAFLLQNGAQVNTKNTQGATPLMYAAQLKCPKTTKLLLTRGANVNETNYMYETALFHAVQDYNGKDEINQCHPMYKKNKAIMFLGCYEAPSWSDGSNRIITGEHVIPGSPRCKCPFYTVIIIKDSPGSTCETSILDTVQHLLFHQADVSITDATGQTVIEYLQRRGDSEILKLLKGD